MSLDVEYIIDRTVWRIPPDGDWYVPNNMSNREYWMLFYKPMEDEERFFTRRWCNDHPIHATLLERRLRITWRIRKKLNGLLPHVFRDPADMEDRTFLWSITRFRWLVDYFNFMPPQSLDLLRNRYAREYPENPNWPGLKY